jgi:hypothetical protein
MMLHRSLLLVVLQLLEREGVWQRVGLCTSGRVRNERLQSVVFDSG